MERGSSTSQKSWETTGFAQSYRPACLCQYNNFFTFCQYSYFYICPVLCRSVSQTVKRMVRSVWKSYHKRNWHLDLFGPWWWFARIDHNSKQTKKKPHCGATLGNKLCISICFILSTIKPFTIKKIQVTKWSWNKLTSEIRTFFKQLPPFPPFPPFRPRPPAKPRFSGWQSRLGHWNGNF